MSHLKITNVSENVVLPALGYQVLYPEQEAVHSFEITVIFLPNYVLSLHNN